MQFTIAPIDVNVRTVNEQQITCALERLERRQIWIVEALHSLIKGQTDEATITALTAKLSTANTSLEASLEAATNPPTPTP